MSEYMDQWRAENREYLLAYNREYNKRNKEARRALDRQRRGQINGPTRPQPETCECCSATGPLCEDHCHTTGLFRGWLCKTCNMGIGLLGDTKEGVQKCMSYLMQTS